jgi:teichuronic acid biosynthesis glycosyltransferase TuaC
MRVLMITSEWPNEKQPYLVPFIVRQVRFLEKNGVKVDVFAFRGRKNPLNYLAAWFRAQSLIRSTPYDLVHAQWGQSGLLALPKVIPLVVTYRGDDLEGVIGPNNNKLTYGIILRFVSRFVSRFTDQVVVVSPSLTRSIKRNDYHVIPSGIDFELFCPGSRNEARRILELDQHQKYVLFVGSKANPTKRYQLARQAMADLADDRVTLITAENIPHERIPDYMRAADVLIVTSLHEGSPNVVKEALACNLPVVSTDVGDVKQRIGNLAGCAVVQDDHPGTIAGALRMALTNTAEFHGRESVADLDENILTKKTVEVYELALASKKANKKTENRKDL